jgi:hypothetical protein
MGSASKLILCRRAASMVVLLIRCDGVRDFVSKKSRAKRMHRLFFLSLYKSIYRYIIRKHSSKI